MQIIQLNLLPPEHQHKRKDISWILDRRVVWPVMMIFILLCTGAMMWWSLVEKESELQADKQSVESQIALQRPILVQLNTVSANLAEIKKKNLALKSIQVSKQKWISVFETISAQMPPNTWLLSIAQGERNPADTSKVNDHSSELKIIANSHKFDEVAKYMEQLVASEEIDSVALRSVQTVQSAGLNVYQMSLSAYVNPFIGIDIVDSTSSKQDSVTKSLAK